MHYSRTAIPFYSDTETFCVTPHDSVKRRPHFQSAASGLSAVFMTPAALLSRAAHHYNGGTAHEKFDVLRSKNIDEVNFGFMQEPLLVAGRRQEIQSTHV